MKKTARLFAGFLVSGSLLLHLAGFSQAAGEGGILLCETARGVYVVRWLLQEKKDVIRTILYDRQRGLHRILAEDDKDAGYPREAPLWTADGRAFYFLRTASTADGGLRDAGIWQGNPNSGKISLVGRVYPAGGHCHGLELSPDGRYLSLLGMSGGRIPYAVVIDPQNGAIRMGKSPVAWGEITWSPEGRWLAYASADGDTRLTGLRLLSPEAEGEVTVTTGFDQHPVWSPDGEKLAFIRRDIFTNVNIVCIAIAPDWEVRILLRGVSLYTSPRWRSAGRELIVTLADGRRTSVRVEP